jgi:cell division protein FtsL
MKKEAVELVGVLGLAAAVVASGIWIVDAEHRSRQLFVAAEEQARELDRLQVDWGRLQIEQSTYATPSRIETLARERLRLTEPDDEALVVVLDGERPR